MAITTYTLNSLYEIGDKESRLRLLETLSSFYCKHNILEINEFLKKQSIEFEERSLSRTYLVCEDTPDNILGYFSISVVSMDISKLSQKQRRLIASNPGATHAPVFLLAHVGADMKANLEKGYLIRTALSYIKKAQEIVGIRMVYLDCDKNSSRLVEHYNSCGFTYLSENKDYIKLIMKL